MNVAGLRKTSMVQYFYGGMQLMSMRLDEGSEVGVDTLKLWDKSIKWLVRMNPQSLVSFLLVNAVFEDMVDRELQVPSIIADGLYTVTWRGEKIMLHVEFQKRHDTNMGRRMWEYNALTNIH